MRPPARFHAAIALGVIVCGVALCIEAGEPHRRPGSAVSETAQPLIIPGPSRGQPLEAPPVPVPAPVASSPTLPAARETQPDTTGSTLRHCSVVGAVRFPGTYAGRRSPLALRTVIELAGGLSEQAAGTATILHDGRNLRVNCAADVVVPAESIVVVESLQPGRGAGTSAADYTDVACLYLRERPVVLWLKPEDATLPRLLGLLGQSLDLAPRVQVLQPSFAVDAPVASLASGTVLVFDPRTLDHLGLEQVFQRWPLQDLVLVDGIDQPSLAGAPIDPSQFVDLRTGAGEAPAPVDAAFSPEAAPPSSARLGVSSMTSTSPEELARGEARPVQPPRRSSAGSNPQPPASAPQYPHFGTERHSPARPGEPAAAHATRDAAIEPASALQLQSIAGPKPLPPGTEDDLFPAAESLKPASARAATARDEVVTDSMTSRFDKLWRSLFTATAAVLCALAAYAAFGTWRRVPRRNPTRHESPLPLPDDLLTEAATPAAPAVQRQSLEPLISNALPLAEEETTVGEMAFHGRAVGYRYLIRSGPHPLRGPHFPATALRSPSLGEAEVKASRAASAPTAAAVPKGRYDRIDRASGDVPEGHAAPHAAESVSAARRSSAARGASSLEDALRRILREQRDSPR